ncbi:hypothetical protein PG997_010559 [Apiospora hydei]|uniref:Uncharacterized protein n=1 Tax=Apiospora hydei TaxID=1337664 RepID=A0ABR1VJ87_9PEZI
MPLLRPPQGPRPVTLLRPSTPRPTLGSRLIEPSTRAWRTGGQLLPPSAKQHPKGSSHQHQRLPPTIVAAVARPQKQAIEFAEELVLPLARFRPRRLRKNSDPKNGQGFPTGPISPLVRWSALQCCFYTSSPCLNLTHPIMALYFLHPSLSPTHSTTMVVLRPQTPQTPPSLPLSAGSAGFPLLVLLLLMLLSHPGGWSSTI